MTRLFVGSFLREDQAAAFRSIDQELKSTPIAKLHITWLFLGELSPEQVLEAKDCFTHLGRAIAEARIKPFDIVYNNLELWPAATPHVGVLTPQDPADEVASVAKLVRLHLGAFEENRDKAMPFRPHLTAIRFRERDGSDGKRKMIPSLVSVENELLKLLPVVQTIQSIDLIESSQARTSEASQHTTQANRTHSYKSIAAIKL